MNRVSTVGNYTSILANLMAAQRRQVEAGQEVSTQKKGADLKDYARNAEMLTAMRSVQVRAEGYLEQNVLVSDRLTTQDTALNQVADAAAGVRTAIADALASGRADTLMEDLQAQFRNAVEGLNSRYGGKYLFAGGQIDTPPMSATSMSQLATPATVIADYFHNDKFILSNKVDEATSVQTGVLADAVGTDMMQGLKDIQLFNDGGSGPLSGDLTNAQRTFLEGQLTVWDDIRSDIVDIAGRNGLIQRRVEAVKGDLIARQNTLKGMMGEITDADMAEAATKLEQAGISVQAAAQVLLSLQNSSLLAILQP